MNEIEYMITFIHFYKINVNHTNKLVKLTNEYFKERLIKLSNFEGKENILSDSLYVIGTRIMTGGGDLVKPTDAPPSAADRVKAVQKSLGDANKKWRDIKAAFETSKSNVESFYKWMLNANENAYDAFKKTYSQDWLKQFTAFETDSKKTIDELRESIATLIENEVSFTDDKKKMYVAELAAAIDERSDATEKQDKEGLVGLYRDFATTVQNLYKQTKSFFEQFETQFLRYQAEIKEVAKATAQQRPGPGQNQPLPVLPPKPPVFNMPVSFYSDFAKVVENTSEQAKNNLKNDIKRSLNLDDTKMEDLVNGKGVDAIIEESDAYKALSPDKQKSTKEDIINKLDTLKKLSKPEDAKENAVMNAINKRTEKLDKVFKDMGDSLKLRGSPALALAGSDNLFARILNDYLTNKDKAPGQEFRSREALVNSLHANRLIPGDVLKINKIDKVVFVFLTLFMRLFGLAVIEHLIERGSIKTITVATFAFLGLYSAMFIAFVLLVNLDMYRLRIVFNMLNMHANGGYVYMHLGLLWLFGAFIYLVLSNLNVFGSGGSTPRATSDYEKQVLISKLQLLTLIVWALLTIVMVLL